VGLTFDPLAPNSILEPTHNSCVWSATGPPQTVCVGRHPRDKRTLIWPTFWGSRVRRRGDLLRAEFWVIEPSQTGQVAHAEVTELDGSWRGIHDLIAVVHMSETERMAHLVP